MKLALTAGTVSREFPSALLEPLRFRTAVWAHRAGLRDYGYVIATAACLQKYWAASGGESDWRTLP